MPLAYTEKIMTMQHQVQHELTGRSIPSQESDSSPVQSRVGMTEVQICGVPKVLAQGVTSTS